MRRWAVLGPAAALTEAVGAYAAAGVDGVVLMPLGPDPMKQYERLAAAASVRRCGC